MNPIEIPGLNKEASYNQAQLQMIRIHEIEKRIDENLICPLKYSYEDNRYNYQKVLYDLYNLLVIVFPKLTPSEKEESTKIRDIIINFQSKSPVFEYVNKDGRELEIFIRKNWNTLSEYIFQFRLYISELMDRHGYGNPDKQSPTTEAIN